MENEDLSRCELLEDDQKFYKKGQKSNISYAVFIFSDCLSLVLFVLTLYALLSDDIYLSLRVAGYLLAVVHAENLLEVLVRSTSVISMKVKLIMEVVGVLFTLSVYTYV